MNTQLSCLLVLNVAVEESEVVNRRKKKKHRRLQIRKEFISGLKKLKSEEIDLGKTECSGKRKSWRLVKTKATRLDSDPRKGIICTYGMGCRKLF